jgi:hypothetical protein
VERKRRREEREKRSKLEGMQAILDRCFGLQYHNRYSNRHNILNKRGHFKNGKELTKCGIE